LQSYKLNFIKGHYFVQIENLNFLLDTGSPLSLVKKKKIIIQKRTFKLPASILSLDSDYLTQNTGTKTDGLIGTDILNQFDIIFDAKKSEIIFSDKELNVDGSAIELNSFFGVPEIMVKIKSVKKKMLFDTGSQISYLQNINLSDYPFVESFTDFFPLAGKFKSNVHLVNLEIGNIKYKLRCGALPDNIPGLSLLTASVDGIIGNEILKDTVTGYFPRSKRVVVNEISDKL